MNAVFCDLFCFFFSGGLSPGDIITHINGVQITNSGDIYKVLGEKGTLLTMTVHRGMDKLSVTVHPEDPDE